MTDVTSYAQLVAQQEARIAKLEKGSAGSQLAYSSIEDGSIAAYDADGQLRQVIGKQNDGTFAVAHPVGPPPPTPSAPLVSPLMSGLGVTWDGFFAAGYSRPADFDHVEVHVSVLTDFAPDASTLQGTLRNPGGWPCTPLTSGTTYYARFVAVSTSGARSETGAQTSGVPNAVVAQAVLDGIVTSLSLADQAVTQAKVAVGAIDTPQLSSGVNASIANAASQAAAGVTAAQNAQTAADAAQATADGAIRTFYQADPPTGENSTTDLGDLWFNTTTNQASRWNGTSWVLIEDNSIANALAAAQNAQTTADGKITSYYQSTAPTAAATGDLWFDTANGNLAKWWDGSTWSSMPVGSNAISAGAVTAGKVAAAAIQAGNLAADSVQAGNVVANAITGREIAALSVTADKVAANAIQAGAIAAGSVTADKLAAQIVLGSEVIAGDPNDWHVELGDQDTPILYTNGTDTGFTLSQDPTSGQANVYLSGRVDFGNGSEIDNDWIDLATQPVTGFQEPKLRQAANTTNRYTGQYSIVAKFNSSTKKGNYLLAAVLATYGGSGIPTTTMPTGWVQIATIANGTNTRLTLFGKPAQPADGPPSVTVTSNLAAYLVTTLYEYQGISTLDQISVSYVNAGSGGTAMTPATTQADELWFAVIGSPDVPQLTDPVPTSWQVVSRSWGLSNQGDALVGASQHVTATGQAMMESSPVGGGGAGILGIAATFKTAPNTVSGVPPAPSPGHARFYVASAAGTTVPYVIDEMGNTNTIGKKAKCLVRLNASYSWAAPGSTTVGNTTYAQNNWVAEDDPYGMLTVGSGAGVNSFVTIPPWAAGTYEVRFFAQFYGGSANGSVAALITRNGVGDANVVKHDLRPFPASGGALPTYRIPADASRIITLAAGDVLYWATWANVAGSVSPYIAGPGGANMTNNPTEFAVHQLS